MPGKEPKKNIVVDGLVLCDVHDNPDAKFSFRIAATKLLRNLMLNCHRLRQGKCHMFIYIDRIRFRVLTVNEAILMETDIFRTSMLDPDIRIPCKEDGESYDGLVAHFDFNAVAKQLPNTTKSPTVTFRSCKKNPTRIEYYFDDKTQYTKPIQLFPAKPDQIVQKTWDTDFTMPNVTVSVALLKSNGILGGNKKHEIWVDVYKKGLIFIPKKESSETPFPIGQVPDPDDDYEDAENPFVMSVSLHHTIFNPLADLINKTGDNGVVSFYMDSDWSHYKMSIQIGPLCNVIFQIFSNEEEEEEEPEPEPKPKSKRK